MDSIVEGIMVLTFTSIQFLLIYKEISLAISQNNFLGKILIALLDVSLRLSSPTAK